MNKEFIKSVEELLELIEDGTLVRDISKDDDFVYFTKQGLRITKILSDVTRNLQIIKENE
jgi:hypothetical protein